MKPLNRDTLRALMLVALHLGVLAVLVFTPIRRWIDEASIRTFVERTGWSGPLVLIGFCVVTPLLMVPRWPLAMAGGLLYGTFLGGALANFGSALGAVVGLLFGRYMARSFVQRHLGRHREAFDRLTDRYGVKALIIFRAIPFTNYVLTNYLAAVSKMRVVPYALASFVGMIPSSFMYAFMGKAAKTQSRWMLALFGVIFVTFSLLTMWLGRRVMRRYGPRAGDIPEEPTQEGEANGRRLG